MLAVFDKLLYMACTGTNDYVFISSSGDGKTFSNPVELSYPCMTDGNYANGMCISLAPALGVFNGKLYLAYSYSGEADLGICIFLSSSNDGTSFGSTVTLPNNQLVSSMSLNVDALGILVVGYVNQDTLTLSSSTDGVNFTTATLGQGGQAALGGIGDLAFLAFTQTQS